MNVRTKPGRCGRGCPFVLLYTREQTFWGDSTTWSGVYGKTRASLQRAAKLLRTWPRKKRGLYEPLMKDPEIGGAWG